MKRLSQIAEKFSRWIDLVAAAIVALRERFMSPRTLELVEGEDNIFVVRAQGEGVFSQADAESIRIVDGMVVDQIAPSLESKVKTSRIKVILQPARFVFRPLELPR